ncbi:MULTISPECIES: ABC transporter permease [Pseudomonas syringae group]|uniref:Binding-protein dependent transport system inner membrane protein n=1 Tax=Pseudomonas syringae pv. ribicola TaxID=55398 RepID=A0A0P9YBH9_PSESI|nr:MULTISPECIES: ABC transporter permease [Pseudomonas syringae group]EKN45320.1 binding-protein dependent transport system inner membrane protein [Pseudomonas viridiflava UASWS0038]KPL63914.1 ABC transporter permease [Pseudomonas viridiflava]KPY42759.1 Binding-protein dependent transport system inner membrane protein [Pseudomonas syringae pv. ribicola]KPZ21506.1 Binding-protein dependent transport system inner membrane protein [Pseudomonas viridiflava]MBI6681082.1 ABC transporter permease [Ps
MNRAEKTLPGAQPALFTEPKRGVWGKHKALGKGLVLPALIIVFLELVVRIGWLPSYQMPAPSEIVMTLGDLAEGSLWKHIGASLLRVLSGFAIGASLALLFAAWVGLSREAEAYLEPTFAGLRSIPSLAWVPLLLLWLGIGETSKIVLIAIGAFFPVYLNGVAAIRGIDRKLVEVGQMYGFSRYRLTRRILLPAALPGLFTGLRSGMSLAWMFLVAAELIAATKGLGYLLSDGRETSRPDIVLAAIVVLASLGKLSDGLLARLERRCLSWRDAFNGQSQEG